MGVQKEEKMAALLSDLTLGTKECNLPHRLICRSLNNNNNNNNKKLPRVGCEGKEALIAGGVE